MTPFPVVAGYSGEALLERDAELAALAGDVRSAAGGDGRAVLISGEAGIGKTSLVRGFLAGVDGPVLAGSCDDLLTPRTFGPLRDAVAGRAGPLAEALRGEPSAERVYSALVDQLNQPGPPTVLLVEDAHWADDATLDALRYLARRLDRVRAVIVLTYRDELDPLHPLRRLLGAMTGPQVRRISLGPLSPQAVTAMGSRSGTDGAVLFAATGGNPFFVTEALACPEEPVPATVVDAVMARVQQLAPPARTALEQLAVVPSQVPRWLAESLIGGLAPIAEAEQRGMVQLRSDGLAFRHELARQALERSLTTTRRMELNAAVVEALLDRPDADLSRVVHHAVAAGDVATVLARGPAAAREAAHAGSHRQALAHYEHVVAHADVLPDDARTRILLEYAWELYTAQRFREGVQACERAEEIARRMGDRVMLGETLVILSRNHFMANQPAQARSAIDRAVEVLDATGVPGLQAHARTHRGALLTLTGEHQAGMSVLADAKELAEGAGRRELVALCLNYLGIARAELGDEGGVEDLRASLALAHELRHHEYVARAYTNLGEVLFALRRYGEFEEVAAEGLQYVTEHDMPGHLLNLTAHQAQLSLLRGDWDRGEATLRGLVGGVGDLGMLSHITLPPLGRQLARRGDPDAAVVLERAWAEAVRSDSVQALAPAGIAILEWAWLDDDPERARPQVELLLERTQGAAGARWRGELLRYLSRAGAPVESFEGAPPEWDAGLRGDWRAAAAAFGAIGDVYEQALELASGGEVAPTMEALATLDRLGAAPAARLVRQRLRELGVTRVPRGPQAATRANVSGLTGRQVDVLALLADGLTNAEIAERLVLSPRTVDHHVSAILTKLGVSTRREAAELAGREPNPLRVSEQ